ncbi:unnamed protein product [Blepharisma stoltei]|uniref:F-actin-capping protein subunit beta n=1 Tax=Blepharisma stoltei TaxID=1481888 RepID=A0AAU9K921_9CILI|nr:unnamed protein product [Blepharisma stoltei]
MSAVLTSSLGLMRRMPPSACEKNLAGVSKLIENEEIVDQVYQRVDKPLELGVCESTGNEFILCEFNRDGDSYRSPYSNNYQPPLPESSVPSAELRQVEVKANEIFNEYRKLYYEGGISSAYLWDTNPNEFAGAFLVKKDLGAAGITEKGAWESTNLVTAKLSPESRTITYTITTTVFLQITINDPAAGRLELSGSVTRQNQETVAARNSLYADPHIYGMIFAVENMESKLRSSIDMIYVGKTSEILDKTRKVEPEIRSRYKLA